MQTIPIFKSRGDGENIQFRNSSAARNPNQGLRNVLQRIARLVISRLWRKTQVSLASFKVL